MFFVMSCKKRLGSSIRGILAFLLALVFAVSTLPVDGFAVHAAYKDEKGYATLRIFSTSDMHGQSTTYSYDTASTHNSGSLAQISTVINKKKKEIKYGNSLLVDCGDVVFGLGAESIETGQISGVQYMYKEMKAMGYDAITLGNHDFDFGYSYIKKALSESGMDKKVLVSNVRNAKTGKLSWASGRIIKKTMKTSKKKKVTVKIGVVGAVVPSLTTYSNWKWTITTEDIVESVANEAEALKDKGADIVVAVVHSGIGYNNAGEDDDETEGVIDNVGYELADIDELDVICCGHTHVNYPSDDPKVQYVYSLPGVSKRTGFINGKIVVQEKDHGAAVGISDIKFKFDKKGKARIAGKKVSVREITAADAEDKKIQELDQKYNAKLTELYENSLSEANKTVDNYFGMLEDNQLVQLANEAKIQYGKEMLSEYASSYLKYPVIASTRYILAGANGGNDYIETGSQLKLKDILNIQQYGQDWAKVYYITGKQLRENLEWEAASIFNENGTEKTKTWSDSVVNSLVQESGMVPVTDPTWEEFKGMAVYDGIEYTIDASAPARYDRIGKIKYEDNHRITNLTCNGSAVRDDQIFVWVTSHVTEGHWPPSGAEINKQNIVPKTKHLTEVISDYVSEQSKAGVIELEADNNWSVVFPDGGNYLVKTSDKAIDTVASKEWYVDTVAVQGGYAYFQAKFEGKQTVDRSPMVVLAKSESRVSGDPIDVYVQASSANGISSISYKEGNSSLSDNNWTSAERVSGNSFKADKNGVYSVLAIDRSGGKTVKRIYVGNINASVATTPTINTVTNVKGIVSGKASPGASVYIDDGKQVYNTQADSSGNYSYDVDYLAGDKNIYVWQVDTKGRESERATTIVARKGANQPILDNLSNKKTAVSGDLNDSTYCKVIAVRGSYVYIPKGQITGYKKTKLYEKFKKKTIRQVTYKCNKSTGRFSLEVPNLYADQNLTVYSYDWTSRASASDKITVEDVAPNQPKLTEVVAQEGWVYGNIPKAKQDVTYTVSVSCDGETYSGMANPDGSYAVKTTNVETGTKVTVKASDTTEDGVVRTSLANKANAIGFEELGSFEFVNGHIDPVNSKDMVISGYVKKAPNQSLYLVYGSGHHEITLNEDGTFTYELTAPRKAKSKVGLISRNLDGSLQTYRYTTVTLAKPDAPEMINDEITVDTRTIKIKGIDKADGYLRIGDTKYKATSVKKKGEKYIYVFKVKDLKKKKKITIWLRNATGNSKKVDSGRVKKSEE